MAQIAKKSVVHVQNETNLALQSSETKVVIRERRSDNNA